MCSPTSLTSTRSGTGDDILIRNSCQVRVKSCGYTDRTKGRDLFWQIDQQDKLSCCSRACWGRWWCVSSPTRSTAPGGPRRPRAGGSSSTPPLGNYVTTSTAWHEPLAGLTESLGWCSLSASPPSTSCTGWATPRARSSSTGTTTSSRVGSIYSNKYSPVLFWYKTFILQWDERSNTIECSYTSKRGWPGLLTSKDRAGK